MNTGAMQAEQSSPAPLLRALILEENAHEATRIVSAVEGGGYKVQCAVLNSPSAFREHLSAGQFDVILADFNLGNWTALDALEILGLLGKSIPLIVVAASRGEDAAAECVKRGAADYVLKERPARLPTAIRQALEMKRLREDRDAAEERFREVVEGTDAIVWEADTATGSVTFVTAGVEKILGYTTDQWLRTPDFWADHIHLADREEALACEREVIEKGKPRSVEYRMRKADGRDRWFRVAMHAVATAEGNVERLRGIMVDISVVKRAERELSESQALANAIVDSTSDLIWSVDPEDFTLLRFNRSLRSYFFHRRGMSIKIGMRPEDLSSTQDYAAQWHKLYRRALSEGSFTTDYVAQSSALTLQLTLNLLKRDGKVFGISVFGKDITERKHAEEQLRHSQEELQSVLASIPDYLWSADIDHQGKVTYRYYSPVVEKLTGRPPEFFMPGPEQWLSTLHPDDLPRLQLAVESITTGRTPHLTEEYRIIHADGSVRWVRDSVQVRRVNGNFRVDGVVSDVTDRRQAEEALRESEERYRRLFEVESDAILVLDAEKERFLDVNAAASELYGYTHDEFLGLTPEEISAEPEKTRASIAHEWMHAQLRWHRKKDGTVFPVEITGNRFLDRKRNIHVAAIRDITERQRAEEVLRLTQFSVEHASDAITWANSEGRIVFANEAACRSLGRSREELLSLAISDIDRNLRPEVWRAQWEELKARGSKTFETEHESKSGAVFPVEVTANYVEFGGKEYCFAFVRDITESKWAEEQLRKLSRAVEQSPATVVITDVEGNMEYVNPKFTQLTGYTFEEAIGKNPRILKSGMVPDATYRDLWQTVLCGGQWRGEFANKKKSGEVYWESASIVPIRGSTGAITHFLAVKEDITERKRGEIALREAETMLRFFVQHAPAAIAMLDREMRYLVVSQRWMTDFRLGDQDIQGHSHYEVFPEIPERWKEIHRRCLAGAVETCPEDPFTRRDGLVDWLRWEIRPWRRIDDNIGGIIICSEHITERKQAEEALRESEARYRAFIEHSREGVWRVELEQPIPISLPAEEILERLMQYGYLAECNLAHAHNLGFSTISEIVGKPLRDLVPSADEGRVESFRAEARSGWHNRGIEFRSRDKSGNLRHFVRTEVPIVCNGMLVRSWGITRDVTDLKRAEEEQQRSLEQLRALAGQLESTREEERKRVAREIHDQLGQSLTAIKMDFSSWLRELPSGANQDTKRTASILELVDESIQTVRRISTELRPGILDDLGLAAAIEWAGEDFESRTGTTCKLDLSRDDIAVNPEQATAIFRIFQETLTNVARHADASAVDVRLANFNNNLTLEVHDNGRGIPKEKHSIGGSFGILGMRERALLLGGEVTITGPPGSGTTVRVRIPTVPSALAGIARQGLLFSPNGREGRESE
ncbi:MAG: PAS domain S-box protein [Terriglobia bacterium]